MAKKYQGTRLGRHTRVRSKLTTGFAQFAKGDKVQFSSWVDERLPEVLWLAILRTATHQDRALEIYRQIIDAFSHKQEKGFPILTHTFMASLSNSDFDRYLQPLFEHEDLCARLGALLFVEELPDRHHWARHLQPAGDPANILGEAVFRCIDHQSQESTDIRWFSVMCVIRNGGMKLALDPERSKEMIREWLEYPHYGDQHHVRPSIRAMEIGLRRPPEEPLGTWCRTFWEKCWERTGCIPGERSIIAAKAQNQDFDVTTLARRLQGIYVALMNHFVVTRKSTALDAKHDAAFGLILYQLYLAYECVVTGAFYRAIGQIIVRVVAESALTLAYLAKRDEDGLWSKYRNYGTGQIKLSFLKMLEQKDVPEFVDMEFFRQLIDEDFWHEHLEIELGHWAGADLRKMSDEAGAKDLYDKYFATTSPFVHSTWGAVRMVSFETCMNPLHRFHRVPAAPNFLFKPVFGDLRKIVNTSLDVLASCYPEFKLRIRDKDMPMPLTSTESAVSEGGTELSQKQDAGSPGSPSS